MKRNGNSSGQSNPVDQLSQSVQQAIDQVASNAGRMMSAEPTMMGIFKIAENGGVFIDRKVQESLAAYASKGMLSECEPGCAYCCYQQVPVMGHELVYALGFFWHSLSDDQREQIQTNVLVRAAQMSGLTPKERSAKKIPCGFLMTNEEGRGYCGIYPARPSTCRGYASLSQSACASSFLYEAGDLTKGPVSVPSMELLGNWASFSLAALGTALSKRGLDVSMVELTKAFADIFESGDLLESWMNGRMFPAELLAESVDQKPQIVRG